MVNREVARYAQTVALQLFAYKAKTFAELVEKLGGPNCVMGIRFEPSTGDELILGFPSMQPVARIWLEYPEGEKLPADFVARVRGELLQPGA